MSKEAFVFEVSKESFGQYVLLNSYKIPVFVQFMTVSSGPATYMAELFSTLAAEFPEQFIFAKVDIDEQPELLKEYQIVNLPTMLVIQDGKVVRKEEGQLQEMEARSLLKDYDIYRESDVIREQAREKHLIGNTEAAILLLTEAIQKDPSNVRVALDMVQIFLDIGQIDQAQGLFDRIPTAAKETDMGKALSGQLSFANLAKDLPALDQLEQKITDHNDMQSRFDMAIKLISLFKEELAMDQLFYIHENEPDFRDGAAKEMIITVTNMIAPVNIDLATTIRRRLANISN